MARAAALRLRAAAEEFVAQNMGDNPRGHARGNDAALVKQVQALLGEMGTASHDAGETPGQRAAGHAGHSRPNESAPKRAWEVPGVTGAGAGDGGQ